LLQTHDEPVSNAVITREGIAVAKEKKAGGGKAKAKSQSVKEKPARAKVKIAVKAAKTKAAEIASNPAVTEVVAATLVAAAAALRDPNKARQMALSAADEIKAATKGGKGSGAALWQLALDVAKRSIDAANADAKPAKTAKASKTGSKKPAEKTKR
jgi:hypothetical protein